MIRPRGEVHFWPRDATDRREHRPWSRGAGAMEFCFGLSVVFVAYPYVGAPALRNDLEGRIEARGEKT